MRVIVLLCLFFWSLSAFANTDVYFSNVRPDERSFQHHHEHYYWQPYRGLIPSKAIVGGEEVGRWLYICQADYMGGVHPGKVVSGNCNITYAGREIPIPEFRVLVGHGFEWVPVYTGLMPSYAMAGGYENGQPRYICQADYADGSHPGKVVAGKCNIGYGGQEIERTEFSVLVMKQHFSEDLRG